MEINRKGVLRITEEGTKGTKATSDSSDVLPLLVGGSLEPVIERQDVNKATGTAIEQADITTTATNALSCQTILLGTEIDSVSNTYADTLIKCTGYNDTTSVVVIEVNADAAFIVGETVGNGTGVTAIVSASKTFFDGTSYYALVEGITGGSFADAETLTGVTSTASATIVDADAGTATKYEAQSEIDDQDGFTFELVRDETLFSGFGGLANVTFEVTPKMIALPQIEGISVYSVPVDNTYAFTSVPEPAVAPRLCGARCFYDTDVMAVSSLSVDFGTQLSTMLNANSTNGECIDYVSCGSFMPTFTINKRATSTSEIAQIGAWRSGISNKTAQFQLGNGLTNGFVLTFQGCQITEYGRSDTDGIDYRGLTLAARGGMSVIVMG